LKFAKGKVTTGTNEWVPDTEEALTWYIEDVVSDALLVRRLELRRNTFLAQQRQVMKMCQTELSRYLIRRKNKKLTSLYKSKTSAFVSKKMDAYGNLSFSHKAYKFNERPHRTSAAAPPEEVAAWMHSVLTGEPLNMYECKRSGKPCIYVESRKNNVTAESIAACAQVSPPKDTMHFATKQQYDIEADKFVQRNLKRCLQKEVQMFDNVLNELGREIRQDGVKIDRVTADSSLDSEEDSDDDLDGNSAEIIDYSKDKEEAEGVTEEMKNDGWEYSADLEQYYRKGQGDRSEMYTTQKPILWGDGKYYALEEIEQKESDPAGGDAQDRSRDDGNDSEGYLSSEEELSDFDKGGGKDDRGDGGDSDDSDSDDSDSDDSDSDGSDSAAAAKAAAEADAATRAAAAAAEAEAAAAAAAEADAATRAAAAAAKEYAERFSRYIARAAQRAHPREPSEYDKQVGVQCGRHATNNFLELEESDRLKMLARFHKREPTGAGMGYASGTIASMFQISGMDDFAVQTTEDSKPFTEDEWNAIRDNTSFMGFIARPPEKGLRDEAQKRNAREVNKLKIWRTALQTTLKPITLQQAALDKTIVLMCRQYLSREEAKNIPNEVKARFYDSTLGATFIEDIKKYVQDADIMRAVATYEDNHIMIRGMEDDDERLLLKILGLQSGWHWVAVRKYTSGEYTSGEFYVINSMGPTVEKWDPTVENANKYSITKILVFSNVEEAGKLRAKYNSKIEAFDKESRRQELRRVTQFARDILKDTFSKSDEESDDLLGPGDEDSDSDSSSEGAAAQRPTKRRKTGALFRMLRDMYI
jgi:hypothetical protein